MLSHRDIIRDVRRALKALPDHPSVCEVTRVPGAGTQTIVVRDASGRPMLTVSTLAAVWAPVIPGRHQQTLDAVAPRPELPAVPTLIQTGYGERDGQRLTASLRTVPTHDRFGLVTVHGADYEIADIGLRMLAPRELFNAQGFPADYVIDVDFEGRPMTKTLKIELAGNSVCPPVAHALAAANVHERWEAA